MTPDCERCPRLLELEAKVAALQREADAQAATVARFTALVAEAPVTPTSGYVPGLTSARVECEISTDAHSFGLIRWMNTALAGQSDGVDEATGRLCYQALRGLDTRCRNCPAIGQLLPGDSRVVVDQDLSFGSRIMAVSDVVSALSEDRPYRRALEDDELRALMARLAASGELDSMIVTFLLRNLDEIRHSARRDVGSGLSRPISGMVSG